MLGKISKRFSGRKRTHGEDDTTDLAAVEHPTQLSTQHHGQNPQPSVSDTSNEEFSTSHSTDQPQAVSSFPLNPRSSDTNVSTSVTYPGVSDSTPNIIIFGESGVGKSSLINMIVGKEVAATSRDAVGCTFESNPCDTELSGNVYRLWDTIGLNEGERGTYATDLAYEHLHRLVQNLKDGGVSLLVYCIRGSRIRDIIKINYDLFYRIICDQDVPIVLVVTGLENEDDMEDWWRDNCSDFERRGMVFRDHACITSTKGKVGKDGKHLFEEEYNQSIEAVRGLIMARCPETSWKPDGSTWLANIIETMKLLYLESSTDSRKQPQVPPAAEQLPEWLQQFYLYIMQQASQGST